MMKDKNSKKLIFFLVFLNDLLFFFMEAATLDGSVIPSSRCSWELWLKGADNVKSSYGQGHK
jgi:hypothetical protein